MLRCGQMILGEALVCRHLGRGKTQSHAHRYYVLVRGSASVRLCLADWRWSRGQKQREEYVSILNAFIDKKDSYYSIHQIGELAEGTAASREFALTRDLYRTLMLCSPRCSSDGSRRGKTHRAVVRTKHSGTGSKVSFARSALFFSCFPTIVMWCFFYLFKFGFFF